MTLAVEAGDLDNPVPITDSLYEAFDGMGITGVEVPFTANGVDTAWKVEVSGTQNATNLTPRDNGSGGENWSGVNRGFNGGPLGGGDRALGIYAGASGDVRYITGAFRNDSGDVVNSITVYWDLEMWSVRVLNNGRWGGMNLQYSTDGSSWTDMGALFDASLSSDAATSATSNYWLDTPLTVANVGGTYVPPAPILDGQVFYLRWNGRDGVPSAGSNGRKKNVGIFIDNVQIELAAAAPRIPPPDPPDPPAPTTSYQAWRTEMFVSPALEDDAISGPMADPDGDRLLNLYEYAFGLDPHIHDRGQAPEVTFSDQTGRLNVSLSRDVRKTDIIIEVEGGSDLVNWTPIARSTAGAVMENLNAESVTESGFGDVMSIQVEDSPSAFSGSSRRFVRIKVSFTP